MAEIWTMGDLLCEIMREKEDVPLHCTDLFRGPFPSGSPGIFISTVARLGHSAGVIGGVGKDDFGKVILDRLKKDGVDCTYVKENGGISTGVAFVTYFSDGDRKFLFHMGNSAAVHIEKPDKKALEGAKYFHIMGCSLTAARQFGKDIVEVMHLMKEAGAKISFDPNLRLELIQEKEELNIIHEVFREANIFMPGREELLLLSGKENVEDAVEECFCNPALELLVLKRGSKGSAIYSRDGSVVNMGVYPVESVDATGAGDSYDGAFISALAEGKTLKEAAKMGAAAGALNAMAFGPMEGNISRQTVEEMIALNEK